MVRRLIQRTVWALTLALGCSSSPSGDMSEQTGPDGPRGPLGKADAAGSCQGEGQDFCGGKSGGACWCDDQCESYGDCCADKIAVCEDLWLSVPKVDSAGLFDALAFKGQDGVVIGKSVKFLIDNRDTSAPTVHFMNANYKGNDVDPKASEFHFYFAREVLPEFSESTNNFNDVTYWTQDKRYFAGTLQEYRLGDEEATLYGIQFYPQDVIAERTVLRAAELLAPQIQIDGARLGFVAMGPQQTTATVVSELAALGVENLTLDEVLGSLNYIPMQPGEAWGYLRIFPQDQDLLSAVDIPVFDELPLDLTVVAGTITRAVQDASSHINLKSKERGTPNMVLRDASPSHERLAPFADKPIHIMVRADGYEIELSSEQEVLEKLQEKLNKPWVPVGTDPAASLASYREMCPGSASACLGLAAAYGGKASNLGFLIHPDVLGLASDPGSFSAQMGYDVAPRGVGVPVQFYVDFVNHAPNGDLRAALADLIAKEKQGTLSVAERVASLKHVQSLFYAAVFPPTMVQDIVNKVTQTLPPETESIKIRSSANAEDIPGFDGAGLYESFRAKLDEPDTGACQVVVDSDGELKVEPKSVACAIKGVYGSLWNKRAIEERSYARIDHVTAAMGIAIVRRYKEKSPIAANSVVVTRVLNSSGVYGYTFSSQQGNNVVTNPAPGTQSETVMAAFLPGQPASFSVTRYAKPDPAAPALTQTVMTEPQMQTMLQINQTVESAYCGAKPDYYPGSCDNVLHDVDKPTALDLELKFYENGDFLCKQVREFAGK